MSLDCFILNVSPLVNNWRVSFPKAVALWSAFSFSYKYGIKIKYVLALHPVAILQTILHIMFMTHVHKKGSPMNFCSILTSGSLLSVRLHKVALHFPQLTMPLICHPVLWGPQGWLSILRAQGSAQLCEIGLSLGQEKDFASTLCHFPTNPPPRHRSCWHLGETVKFLAEAKLLVFPVFFSVPTKVFKYVSSILVRAQALRKMSFLTFSWYQEYVSLHRAQYWEGRLHLHTEITDLPCCIRQLILD